LKKVFKKVINRFGFDIKKYIPENADSICYNRCRRHFQEYTS